MAYECRSAAPTKVGVVVMPDVRGLHAYYRDLTVRLAELGWDAVAIDYFGRTAETEDRSDSFDCMPLVKQATPEGVAADVQAGVSHMRSLGVEKVFTLGFCFGGMHSWRQSAVTPDLAGCIGFYGRSAMALPVVDEMTAPLLILHAGADPNIPVEDPKQIADQASVVVDFVVFDGMPHSFFDRTAPEHADACLKAWNHIIGFVAAHS
jgi:carboxymethylenebutenolidase